MCDTRDEYLAESDALAIEPLRRHRNLTLRGSIFTFLTLRGSFLYIPNLRKKNWGSKLEKGGGLYGVPVYGPKMTTGLTGYPN